MPDLTQDDIERRIAAKRHNERIKLIATTLNACALAVFGSAIILPAVSDATSLLRWTTLIWFIVAFGLHYAAHKTLRFLKSED